MVCQFLAEYYFFSLMVGSLDSLYKGWKFETKDFNSNGFWTMLELIGWPAGGIKIDIKEIYTTVQRAWDNIDSQVLQS